MVEQAKNTCEQVFGKRLRELRKENGYTIEQFADMVGISKSTLGYYENDKRMPDIEILARIANVLNVNADYLIGRTNTTAQKGKMKTVCEFTELSHRATLKGSRNGRMLGKIMLTSAMKNAIRF